MSNGVIDTILLLPSPPALLPPTSLDDPVADLRKACVEAVAALPAGPVAVAAAPLRDVDVDRGVTQALGRRVAAHLLGDREEDSAASTLVVVADGSARRFEKAPGHLDPRAVPFDDAIERALRDGDDEALAGVDPALADELWCQGAPGLRLMGEVARDRVVRAEVTYAEAPYGVAWWVARWDLT